MRPATRCVQDTQALDVIWWRLIAVGVVGLGLTSTIVAQSVKEKPKPAVASPAKEKPKAAVAAVATAEPVDYIAKPDIVSLAPVLFYSAALSPDGAWAAGGTSDWTKPGDLLLWNVASRQLKFQLHFNLGVRSVAFSRDSRLLAAGTFTNEIVLIDVTKAVVLARWTAHSGAVNGLAFSPDGKLLASASLDQSVKLWDVTIPAHFATGLPLKATLRGHSDWVFTADFSADGKTLFTTGKDQRLVVWDIKLQQESTTWEDFPSVVETLKVSPDGELIALGMWNGAVQIRKTSDGSTVTTLQTARNGMFVDHLSFSTSGLLLATAAGDGMVKVWELPTGKLTASIKAHQGKAWAAALTPDGGQILSAGSDGLMCIWDTKTQKQVFQFQQQSGIAETDAPIVGSVWSRDRSIFVTAHTEGSVRVRHPQTGRTLKLANKNPGTQSALALSPDNTLLAAGGGDKTLFVWNISDKIGVPVLLNGHTSTVTSVVFTPDGKWIFAGAADGSVRQWDAVNGTAGLVLEAGENDVVSLACSADGSWLAAGGQKKTIPLWNLAKLQQKPTLTLQGHQGIVSTLAFAPQQALLASASEEGHSILLWNLSTLKSRGDLASAEILKPRPLGERLAPITSLSFSPRGSWLASGSQNKTIRLWNAETGAAGQILKVDNVVQFLSFNADASTLMGVGRDKILRTWNGQQVIPFATTEGRYIKLKSLSEITVGPCCVVAEIRVVQDGALVPQQNWKLVSVDAEVATLPGALAFDGKPETHWHTPYLTDVTPHPHQIVIDLGQSYQLSGLSVLHRSDVWAPNGSIKDYEFFVGNDPKTFGPPVSKGQFSVRLPPK